MKTTEDRNEILKKCTATLDAAGHLAEEGFPDQSRVLLKEFQVQIGALKGNNVEPAENAPASLSLLASLHQAEKQLESLYTESHRTRPNIYRQSFLAGLLVAVFVVLPYRLWLFKKTEEFIQSPAGIRVRDLRKIREAIERYHEDHGRYPSTADTFAGIHSCWGPETEDWVPGLVGKYIDKLPRDPRNLTACDKQYLYRSDGREYKLLAHRPNDEREVLTRLPDLTDPVRTYAYGYWSRWGEYL